MVDKKEILDGSLWNHSNGVMMLILGRNENQTFFQSFYDTIQIRKDSTRYVPGTNCVTVVDGEWERIW